MAASSDGGQAIEVVIEKLQEIVDDIQKNGQEYFWKLCAWLDSVLIWDNLWHRWWGRNHIESGIWAEKMYVQ